MTWQNAKHMALIVGLIILVPVVILVLFRKRIFGIILKPEQEKYIAQLNKQVRFKFEKFIERVEKETDYNVIITSGYRTFAEQQKQYEADPENNPKPGRSMHNYGLALDINAVSGTSYLRKSSSIAAWEKSGIPKIAREMGFTWGGDFKTYHDPVHFGFDRTYNVDNLYAQAISQFGDNWENIHGNQVKLS